MAETLNKSKRKRRWFRFGLRTFLIIVMLSGITLGWFVNRVERQKKAVAWARENGAYVSYEYQFDSEGNELEGESWKKIASDWIGPDYVFYPNFIWITDHIVDLSPLVELSRLETLFFATPVYDIVSLQKLTNLKHISLMYSINEKQMTELTEALPDVKIGCLNPHLNVDHFALLGYPAIKESYVTEEH